MRVIQICIFIYRTEINYKSNYGNYTIGADIHNRLFHSDIEAEQTGKQKKKEISSTIWVNSEYSLHLSTESELSSLIQYSLNIGKLNICRSYIAAGLIWRFKDNNIISHSLGAMVSDTQFHNYNVSEEFAAEFLYSFSFKNINVKPALHLIKNSSKVQPATLLRFSLNL